MRTAPYTPWLYPEEHRDVVMNLHRLGLIQTSDDRSLPLKSGGKTDIYINLRDARNNPEALSYLARLYAVALRRIRPDRFVEIPDSVSCFAGPLSIETGIPYLTIREDVKQGRATDVIGSHSEGETVCVIDDVITDDASKVAALYACVEMKLKIAGLVVLVDRQQGWKETLEAWNIPVCPGLTLHDVRRQLIELGLLRRCTPTIEDMNPIIVALDGLDWEKIQPIADQLRTTGCILKVNDLLFAKGIENLLPNLSVYGRVMADLKLHDIPNTVANACKRLKPFKPWAVTVHASGTEEMIKAAVGIFKDTGTLVLAVTVLTSINDETCESIYGSRAKNKVLDLANIAAKAGVNGFVCSPHEVAMLREKFPDKCLVVPGIRSNGVEANDQKRTDTPGKTLRDGANHLVMGRQILNAPNMADEVNAILLGLGLWK